MLLKCNMLKIIALNMLARVEASAYIYIMFPLNFLSHNITQHFGVAPLLPRVLKE